MAIMIPDKPIEIPIGSREDEMFIALSDLPDDYFVFHSFVLVTNTEGIFRESETDFIVFHPQKGLLCLEAKAGRVFCSNGIWFYGSGNKMKRGGPYRQAEINKWKLEKYFEEKNMLDTWNRCKKIHAVWFPSIKRTELYSIQFPAEADKSITLTEESLTNIKYDIDKIFSLRLPSGLEMRISSIESQKILSNILCPSFNLVPSMVSEVGIKKNAFKRLLKEQSNILNFLEEQPFAVINGAAGTGKTMIALEKARRHAEKEEKVLFICFNRFLCDYLKANYAHKNIVYFTINGLACSYCGTVSADFKLLEQKLESAYYDGNFPFRHVIIDEGQDFGQDYIEETDIIGLLETIVLSEEVSGSFYLFYDKNQLVQGYVMPKYISDSDCKLSLYKNCRNTENIAVTSMRPLGLHSLPKMFEGCVKGDSPCIMITESRGKQLEYLDITLRKLVDQKVNDIVILTSSTEENSFLNQYCNGGSYIKYNHSFKFTTYRKFKGLEADAIILVDVTKNTFENINNLSFYVGASRAKFYLNIICSMNDDECTQILNELNATIGKNTKKSLAAALNAILIQ